MSKLKDGPPVPGWAVVAVIVVGVAVLLFVAYRGLTSGGPRDPSTFPKEAYRPPGYGASTSAGSAGPYGQRPSGAVAPSTSAGNPYGGAYSGGPGSAGMQGGPTNQGGPPQRPDDGLRGTSGGM